MKMDTYGDGSPPNPTLEMEHEVQDEFGGPPASLGPDQLSFGDSWPTHKNGEFGYCGLAY